MKILFFSPFSNIQPHTFTEFAISQSLKEMGHEIISVNCSKLYKDFCISMSASGLTENSSKLEKRMVCFACQRRKKILSQIDENFHLDINDYLSEIDFTDTKEIMLSVQPDNWNEFEFENIPLGRYSAYELLLHHKVNGTDIPSHLFSHYEKQLEYAILTFIAAKRIFQEFSPDRLVVYNKLYGVNHAVTAAAEKMNIPTYSIQGGLHNLLRNESITLFRDSYTTYHSLESNVWRDSSTQPISEIQIAQVRDHLTSLMSGYGPWAYSPKSNNKSPKQIKNILGISNNLKNILVPLSSDDEFNGALIADLIPERPNKPTIFQDQLEWLRFLIDIADSQPNVNFIIRLHPRMLPNQRESVTSETAAIVEKMLENAPKNVFINHPNQDLSIYDLVQIISGVVGYRSSVTAELSAFGVPSVTPSSKWFYTYPDTIGFHANTRSSFTKAVIELPTKGFSLSNSIAAFRWYNFMFERLSASITSTTQTSVVEKVRPKKSGIILWLWKRSGFFYTQLKPLNNEKNILKEIHIPAKSKKRIQEVISRAKQDLSHSNQQQKSNSNEEINEIKRTILELRQSFWESKGSDSEFLDWISNNFHTN